MSVTKVKQETSDDEFMQKLIDSITSHNECRDSRLQAYKGVFDELWVIDGMVMRGHQIVLPVSMVADEISLAHEGQQGIDKTLKLLRETCWFPGMRLKVEQVVKSCHGCNAALPNVKPVPLTPNLLPDRPINSTPISKGQSEGSFIFMPSSTSFPNFRKSTL